jgi:hypothetical protein
MKNSGYFLVLIALCGVTFRVLSGRGDLWLDEAISFLALREWGVGGPLAVFDWVHDNNHPLNSLWMYFVGSSGESLLIRLLSLMSGLGSLLLICTWPVAGGFVERVSLTVLWSFSYLLCLYDSEARGYAAMIFFGLLAWRASLELRGPPRWKLVVLLNISLMLSSLAHVIGIYWFLFIALLVGLQGAAPTKAAIRLLLLAPATLFLGAYYWLFIRLLPEGSGGMRSYLEVLLSAIATGAGGNELSAFAPQAGLFSLFIVMLYCILLAQAFGALWKSDKNSAGAFLFGILVVPALVLLMFEPRVMYERYLLVPIVLSYFLLSSYLAALWKRSLAARVFVGLLLFAYVAGNAPKLAQLVVYGRGTYSAAFSDILREAPAKPASVAFDQNFRGGVLVELYGEGKGIKLEPEVSDAEWYILSSQERGFAAPSELDFKAAGRFLHVKSYPAAPLSGFSWFLYRRSEVLNETTEIASQAGA